ncbi:MAG: UMP kinase [Chelatococcus sp.]|jgi:uridylate kinase|uniref:UMP kinase n=1 Tax=unclassified Chelatococcus TaxID=2638111 RepID=UPI001BCDED4D|nr:MULTISPECIES: UMP kinase [unclassified Chelatococcus]CAH1673161.1 UMP kinase [Hyphomicrobiales bacterium]MBS7738682.1 UMP kinase [Chelatococcus sp. HY11]MBX3539959.1 UMP kinase [Chelatococcus sp.]MBX3543086.1 UMP kinase [Chelatococcus sp.]MCO5076788.1 UMP kinase [Chelatococcus sp.]
MRIKRALIKLSGEVLAGTAGAGLHGETLTQIAADIATAAKKGHEIAIVVGGGNFFRGVQGLNKGLDRPTADSIGMLGTVMNALALEHAIEAAGVPARAMSAVPMPSLCESYARRRALDHLAHGKVVVLGGGLGNPYFTTDTPAVLRAAELDCQALLKATNVDGVYTADPKKDPTASRFESLTHDEAIARNLKVMDTAAFALAREAGLPIVVFSILDAGAIGQVLEGSGRATIVAP